MKYYKLLIITYMIYILSSCTSKPSAVDPQSVASPTFIASISGTVLLAVKLAAQNRAQTGKISPAESNCIASIELSYFDATTASILDATFTAGEKKDIEEFLTSPTGKKWRARDLLMMYVRSGNQPPEPLPIFSKEDLKYLNKFFKSSAGDKMISSAPVIVANLKLTLEPKMFELFSKCKQVQPILQKKHNANEITI